MTKVLRCLLTCFFAIAISNHLLAQEKTQMVHVVKDKVTSLEFVNVSLKDTNFETVTNNEELLY
jgi:hypothetical protein